MWKRRERRNEGTKERRSEGTKERRDEGTNSARRRAFFQLISFPSTKPLRRASPDATSRTFVVTLLLVLVKSGRAPRSLRSPSELSLSCSVASNLAARARARAWRLSFASASSGRITVRLYAGLSEPSSEGSCGPGAAAHARVRLCDGV